MPVSRPEPRAGQPFVAEVEVRFRHCDPAGIMFYPRILELVNDVVEDWFDQALGHSFALMHGVLHHGTPTVQLDARFLRPSRIGDRLRFAITVLQLGNSSATLAVLARCGDEERLHVTLTLVHTDQAADPPHALPWPAAVRTRMNTFLQPGPEDAAAASRS